MHPGCGKSFNRPDICLRHCKKTHPVWLEGLARGAANYCTAADKEAVNELKAKAKAKTAKAAKAKAEMAADQTADKKAVDADKKAAKAEAEAANSAAAWHSTAAIDCRRLERDDAAKEEQCEAVAAALVVLARGGQWHKLTLWVEHSSSGRCHLWPPTPPGACVTLWGP